jgi:hypothetical protein
MRGARLTGARTISFGSWKARRASRELIGPAGTRVLEPEVMELLFLLAENGDERVACNDILDRLSPLGVTSYDAMIRCIARLQEAVGDDPRAPTYVVTATKPDAGPLSQRVDSVRLTWPSRPWWAIALTGVAGFVLLALLLWLARGARS